MLEATRSKQGWRTEVSGPGPRRYLAFVRAAGAARPATTPMIDYAERLEIAVSGRYRIERELGSGGMSTVYLAEDLKHDRRVAIKVLRTELAAAMGSDRFLGEIQIAAKLQHPHILMLIDSGRVADSLYYVMPFVDGESLRERLERDGALPIDGAARILRDVVDALAYAHKQGVVHRDMKPDNVMLTERHALVTDFGVAQAVSGAAVRGRLMAADLALGTPAYMAPEQAVAHEQIDHRADIYAVGALGYELMAGRPPFVGESAQQVLRAQVTEVPEPLARYRESVPETISRLIMRCLEKRPEDRWQRAEEMLPELERMAAAGAGAATDIQGGAVRRWSGVIWSAAVLVVAAAVAATIALTSRGPDLDPRRVIVVPFQYLSLDRRFEALGQVAASWVAEGLQQADLVRVVPIQAVEAEIESGAESEVRSLAALMHAGTAVSGSYYVRGDSIHFTSEIVDVSGTELLAVIPTVSALADDPMGALEHLRRQVLGVLAGHFDPWISEFVDEAVAPPVFSAFRSYLAGMARFTRYDNARALPHFYRAAQLDSMFLTPAIAAAVAHWNLAEYASADSLVRSVDLRRERLLPLDRYLLDFVTGLLRGEYVAAHEAARQALLISPGGGWWEYQAGWTALAANRPRATVDHLQRLNPEQASVREWPYLWTSLSEAEHLLGNLREELRVATRGREQHPARLSILDNEVRARAALGRVEEVMSLLDGSDSLPDEAGFGRWDLMIAAALEFRAHGHDEAFRATVQRTLGWLDSRSAEEKARPERLFQLARTLYYAERWEEAMGLLRGLSADSPFAIARWGWVGVTDARLGNATGAQRMNSLLAAIGQAQLYGEALAWRARIAAVSGRPAEATELLAQAIREGLRWGVWVHRDIDLESLREYEPFQELARPRG